MFSTLKIYNCLYVIYSTINKTNIFLLNKIFSYKINPRLDLVPTLQNEPDPKPCVYPLSIPWYLNKIVAWNRVRRRGGNLVIQSG